MRLIDKPAAEQVLEKILWKQGNYIRYEYQPLHDKTNKMTVPSEDSDQSGHPPSLIRIFAVRSMGS